VTVETTEISKRTIGLIWAQTRAGVIGAGGTIPWHIPEDLAHFKSITDGHVVIMGRKTWESLPADVRPLPGRRNIVVTRNPEWSAPGAGRAESVAEALALTDPEEVWVIGGGEIYREAMPFATVISVTEVSGDYRGDVYAPDITDDFIMAFTTGVQQSADGANSYLFRSYARK
jgi:dihydrofolate reductase